MSVKSRESEARASRPSMMISRRSVNPHTDNMMAAMLHDRDMREESSDSDTPKDDSGIAAVETTSDMRTFSVLADSHRSKGSKGSKGKATNPKSAA